jgi:hypothetical protein
MLISIGSILKVYYEDYYMAHLPIVADRIEKAGIRLAGVLNHFL